MCAGALRDRQMAPSVSISLILIRRVNGGWVSPAETVRKPTPNAKLKGDLTMRFMMLVKHAENSGAPPKELMDAIAKLSEEAVKAGTMVASGGLAPTAASTRVRVSRGQIT